MAEATLPGAGRLVAGRYQLARELGRDGMGVVWLADDTLIGRQVAIKELRAPAGLAAADRETFSQRALAEARNAARVRHRGAVTLHDVIPAAPGDGAVYLVMEFIQAPTLAQVVEHSGPLDASRAAAIGLQLLDVLDAAHTLGVIHRDVKPANIMIEPSDRALLADFGIAHTTGDPRLTRSGILGTQAYLAPELFENAPLTPAADLWSLGASLYHAISGTGPFDRQTTASTLRAILIEDLPAPPCPPPLATAITGLLTRDPARRATSQQARPLLQQVTTAPAGPPHPADTGPVALRTPWEQQATTYTPGPPRHPGPQPPPPYAHGPQGAWGIQARPRSRRLPWLLVAAAVALVGVLIAVPLVLNSTKPHPIATLTGPGGSVDGVAFSPSGSTIATTDGGTTYLWNTATTRHTLTLTDPAGTSSTDAGSDRNCANTNPDGCVAFSPDGSALATADDTGSAYLWNAVTGKLTATLTDPADQDGNDVDGVAFSPGGSLLATADQDGSTYLWNVATGKLTATLTDPANDENGINGVAFGRDGTTLATADFDGSVYLWDVATGTLTATLPPPAGEHNVESVAFSPGGATLAAVCDNGSVYLWDVATRAVTATLTVRGEGTANGAAFSPHSSAVLVTISGNIYFWNAQTGKMTKTLPDPGSGEYCGVAFSQHGSTLAVADCLNSTYLWNVSGMGS